MTGLHTFYRAVVILLAVQCACLWLSSCRTRFPPVVPSLELTPVWFSSPASSGSADGSLSWRPLEASSLSVCVTSGAPGRLCRQGQAAQRLSPMFAELPAIWSVGSFLPRAPYLQEAFSLDYFSRPSLPLGRKKPVCLLQTRKWSEILEVTPALGGRMTVSHPRI